MCTALRQSRLDEPTADHPGDLVGQAAAFPLQRVGERGHPQRAVGLAEVDQHLELGLREARRGLEVALDLQVQAPLDGEVVTPQRLLLVVQPSHVLTWNLFSHAPSVPG